MLIYVVTNKINGKQYVGQTIKTLHERWMLHLWCAKNNYRWPIYAAIRKYGIQSFELQVIDVAISSEELDEKEVYWIAKLKTLSPNGYNIAVGGNKGPVLTGPDHPCYGKPKSAEARAKISATLKGHGFAPETLKKMSDAKRGKKHTTEARENMRKAKQVLKGVPLVPEHCAKIAAAKTGVKRPSMTGDKHPMFGKPGTWRGRHHTEETKTKLSTVLKKHRADNPFPLERIARQQAARKKTLAARGGYDQKCIDAMRQANLGRKKDPVEIERSAVARRGQKRTPEQRARMRAGHAARKVQLLREQLALWNSPVIN